MKITEVTFPSLKSIRESLEANNETGLASSDLMKIAQQNMHGSWGQSMTADEANQEVMRIVGGQSMQSEAKPGEAPAVVFKSCEEFVNTLAKWGRGNAALIQKLQEFHKTKEASPMQPFGKNDSRLIATGPLGRAVEGLRHAHLSQDLSIFYTLGGSNPHIIYQYGIYSHNESGTGNSQNIKVQKNLGKRMANQQFK
jgi:hypothetical protein